MPLSAVYAMIAAVLLAAGGVGGYQLSNKINAGSLMQCKMDGQKMLAVHEHKSNQRLKAAAESTDQALAYAMQRIIDAEHQATEAQNEIKNLTTGRDCLSADAVRLLEQSSAFEQQRMPTDPGDADPTNAAAAADTGDRQTTDTDLAEWIAEVSGLYEQCRARIDAIWRWNNGLDQFDGRH